MNHHAAPSFWRCYDGLPEAVRTLADKQFELLNANPHHPSLHFKRAARGFRFYFFSREEPRMHVHEHPNGEAKFWLEPDIEIAQNFGLRTDDLGTAEQLIKEHENEGVLAAAR